MFKYILAGVLTIGVLAIGVRVATQALFTDTQSVGANTFSTGTVDIVTSPTTALVTLPAMTSGFDPTRTFMAALAYRNKRQSDRH